MLIAIISDIHDNLSNLEKCLNWCRNNKIEKIICLGDVTNKDTLHYLAGQFAGEIFLVRGAELYDERELKKYKNVINGGLVARREFDGITIGFGHRPQDVEPLSAVRSDSVGLDFVFCGHTHKPWLENRGALTLANPGNLANVFYAPTFAVLDTVTKKLALKILTDL